MGPMPTTKGDAQPPRLSDQIDLVCDQFETGLRNETSPRIEEMLQRVQDGDRSQVLRRLIAVEIAFDQALGKTVDFSTYLTRFPEVESAIHVIRAQFELNSLRVESSPVVADGENNETGAQRPTQFEDVTTVTFKSQLTQGIGNYQLLERIGRGGGGEVYAARHIRLERRDAVKLLAAKDAGDTNVRKRFLREMLSIGRLKHPHIVQAYDAGEVDGVLYLAMELVEGPNVDLFAQRISRMEIADACEIVRQAAVGLQHIHEHGLVHRDLKPSNLLLSSSGVKIADLGLALLRSSEPTDDRLTGTFVVMGTADYIAPEQAENARDVDIRADLYSLGCTLYRLLSGQAPFAYLGRGMVLDKLRAHIYDPAPDIRTQRPDISKQLLAILEKLLAKNREERFSQPLELVEALAPYCGGADLTKLLESKSTECDMLTRRNQEEKATAFLQHQSRTTIPLTSRHRILQYVVLATLLGSTILLLPYISRVNLKEHPPLPALKVPTSQNEADIARVPATTPPPAEVKSHRDSVVPKTLLSSDTSANSFFQINEGTNKLQVVSQDLLMLKLGTIERVDTVIEIAMEVNGLKPGVGHAGVFVGYRNSVDHEQSQFQWVRLQASDDGVISRRATSTFHPRSPRSRNLRNVSSILMPGSVRVNTLNLMIVNGELHQLNWNGLPVERLAPSGGDASGDNDFTGNFGVYAYEAVAVFSDYRVNGKSVEFKP